MKVGESYEVWNSKTREWENWQEHHWYAVLSGAISYDNNDEPFVEFDDDWGNGSLDREEALDMAREDAKFYKEHPDRSEVAVAIATISGHCKEGDEASELENTECKDVEIIWNREEAEELLRDY